MFFLWLLETLQFIVGLIVEGMAFICGISLSGSRVRSLFDNNYT